MTKKRYSARRNSKSIRFRRFFLLSLLFVFLCFGVFLYRYPSAQLTQTGTVSQTISHLKNWMIDRKAGLNKQVAKAKQLAIHKSEPKPAVHFEFYTALPKMQIEPSHTSSDSLKNNSPRQLVNRSQESISPLNNVFNAEQLEKDFSQQLAQKGR
jgi:hypothetical protein